MDITLYHCQDARSLRPLWALEELGLDYKLVKLPFPPRDQVEGYREINPLGTVPTLQIDGRTMTESAAMCEYLAERAGGSPLHIDAGEPDRPIYIDWLHRSDATLTFPLTILLRYTILEPEERRSAQVAEDYRNWFLSRAKSVERALDGRDHLCAGRFTAADIAVAYALYLAVKLEVDIGPRSRGYLARMMVRDGFQRAIAAQADMPASF
jgi:glutathione S-transferase